MLDKKYTLFDFLNAIFYKKNIKYNKKIANAYILTLWLSHEKDLIDTVNRINKHLFDVPDEAVYQYYFSKIPKGSRFIKYTKKDKKIEDDLTEMCKKYNISKREAKLSTIKEEE